MLTSRLRAPQTSRLTVLALLAGTLATASGAVAQEFQDLKKPATPLVLQSQGSFTVGGDIVVSDALGAGGSGHIAVNQMYVQYKVPPASRVPVVMVHGADLSGKSYETTPDGRMGWEEYFVRKGHAVYLPDQVSRARSGFDPTVFNRVHSGAALPSAQPVISRFSNEHAWTVFRFGPTFGVPYPDEQFPVEAMGELAKQMSSRSISTAAAWAQPNPQGSLRFGSEPKGRRSDGSLRIRPRSIGSRTDQCSRN